MLNIPKAKFFLLGIVFLGVTYATTFATGQTQTGSTIHLSPGDNIQAAVDMAPEGTTFILRAGVYRMQSVTPKHRDTFVGDGLVVLNGSRVLTFRAAGKNLWVADGPANTYRHGMCQKEHPLCDYSQDLFQDSKVQQPVTDLALLKSGSWYFDRGTGKVYIADNPEGHLYELGASHYAFGGSATDVHIRHLVLEKYQTQAQHGAIDATGSGWVADGVEARLNHGGGIVLGGGTSQILNSYVHHNGQKGVTMKGKNCQLINTEISWNNYAGFEVDWEGGASKFVYTDGLVAKSNYIHDNNGHGLWTDTDNVHTTYENNTIINNRGDGIKHEASYDVVIARNTIKGNGFVPTVWMGNAQIRIQTSSSADIYGNTIEVAPNYGNGIAVTNQKRVEGIYGRCVSSNNRVHDNTITYLGPAGLTGFVDDTGNTSGLGNTFDNNRYIVRDGSTKHWEWMGPKTWTEMKAAGQEQHGTCCK